MRIGMDIRELEKDKMTGIGRYLLNFLSYVSKYDKENEYILFGNQKTLCPISGINITLKIMSEFNRIYWDQILLAKQLYKENIDIFFSPNHKFPIFSPIKSIITVHDLYPFLINDFDPLPKILLMPYYYKFMFHNADFIITVSEYTKKMMLEQSNLDSNKIKVIYNCVGEEFKILEKKECLKKLVRLYGIDKDFILYVGNLKPHKNLKRLIEAYYLLSPNLRSKFELVIIAKKDTFFPALYKMVKDNNLEKDVIFTDFVRDDELAYFYNAATAYISVSLHEGFGLPFVEAMACGTPVISANVSASPEIVGDAAILLDPLDIKQISRAMQMMLTDEQLRKELSKKGLERAKIFSVKSSSEQLLRIFKELIA